MTDPMGEPTLISGSDKSQQLSKELESRFTYHMPKHGQAEIYQEIRDRAKGLAYYFEIQCPESREKSLAITKLEETVMWANAAIARRS